MNVEKLTEMLQHITGEKEVGPFVRTLAHWTKRIKQAEKFVTRDEREINSLKRMQNFQIIELAIKEENGAEEATAKLTKEGRELSDDFFRKGFYL